MTPSKSQPIHIDGVPFDLRMLPESHPKPIHVLSWSPNGRMIASGARDNSVRLWDANSGHLITPLVGHHSWVTALAWDPKGTLLASGSKDQTVRIWDTASHGDSQVLSHHGDRVLDLCWSPCGQRLASACRDGKVRVFDRHGKKQASWPGHAKAVTAVTWLADSNTIVTGSLDGRLCWWDLGQPNYVREKNVNSSVLCLSQVAGNLAIGTDDSYLRVLRGDNGAPVCTHTLESTAHSITAGNQNQWLLVESGKQGRATIWNPVTWQPRGSVHCGRHHGRLMGTCLDPLANRIAVVADNNRRIRVLEPSANHTTAIGELGNPPTIPDAANKIASEVAATPQTARDAEQVASEPSYDTKPVAETIELANAPIPGHADTADSPLRVFLCHASEDKKPVRSLYRKLKQEGFDPWLDDEELLPGQKWAEVIPSVLETMDAIVVCLTHHAMSKEGYVHKEVAMALDLAEHKPEGTIFVIPVLFEPCEVPRRLSAYQVADMTTERGL